jgi:hypothetical protein
VPGGEGQRIVQLHSRSCAAGEPVTDKERDDLLIIPKHFFTSFNISLILVALILIPRNDSRNNWRISGRCPRSGSRVSEYRLETGLLSAME